MAFTPEEIKNLEALLRSPVEDNIKLAFAILEGKAYPESIKILLGEYEKLYHLFFDNTTLSLQEILIAITQEAKNKEFFEIYEDLQEGGLFKNIKRFYYYPKNYEVRDFPSIINKLTNLERLHIHMCDSILFRHTYFFSGENLPHLKEVKLDMFGIGSGLMQELSKLKSLKTLHLNNITTPLAEIDFSAFTQLVGLTGLGLSENDFSNIDLTALGELQNLEDLWLAECNLTYLPDFLTKLTNLSALDISTNSIGDFSLLEQLPQLEYLGLEKSNLNTVPNSLSTLINLKEVYLDRNYLSQADFTPLMELKNLERLYLEGSSIWNLPDSLKTLQDRGVEIYY